jgi:hypothetical protein
MIKKALPIFAVLLLCSTGALAKDTKSIYGKYVYSIEKMTFANGTVMGLSELGMAKIYIEFRPDMTILMNMQMMDGSTRTSSAKILSNKATATGGSLVEKWAEMDYAVTLDYTYLANGVSYAIRFTNPADSTRYGAVEQAVLTKVSNH